MQLDWSSHLAVLNNRRRNPSQQVHEELCSLGSSSSFCPWKIFEFPNLVLIKWKIHLNSIGHCILIIHVDQDSSSSAHAILHNSICLYCNDLWIDLIYASVFLCTNYKIFNLKMRLKTWGWEIEGNSDFDQLPECGFEFSFKNLNARVHLFQVVQNHKLVFLVQLHE